MTDDKKGGISIGVIGTGRSAMELIANMHGKQAGDSAAAAAADPVGRPPDISGPHGRAWVLDLPMMRRLHNRRDDEDATLALWLIEAPWAHPCWHSFELVLVHLRQLRDHEPPVIYRPGATHELWLVALDPSQPRNKRLTGAERVGAWLHPLNFAAQIVEISDALAIERAVAAVRDIVDGKLSPDTDHISAWVQRFGDYMIKR